MMSPESYLLEEEEGSSWPWNKVDIDRDVPHKPSTGLLSLSHTALISWLFVVFTHFQTNEGTPEWPPNLKKRTRRRGRKKKLRSWIVGMGNMLAMMMIS